MNTEIQKGTGLSTPGGVSDDMWARLATPEHDRFAIVERDAMGEVVGTAYRHADGSKSFAPGGRRGLIVGWPLSERAGMREERPVYVCEGASDTASLMSLAMDAVGVPMAGACADELARLLEGRHAVVVADADAAGERGARKLIEALVPVCPSVRLILPPLGAKDARGAVEAGAGFLDFDTLAMQAEPITQEEATITHESKDSESGVDLPFFRWTPVTDLGPGEMPRWLWPGAVARGGITLMTGLWKAGKTTLVMHLLRDLYRGGGLVEEAASGPTLVVSEEGASSWARRREELALDRRIHYLERDTYARLTKEQWPLLVANIASTVRRLRAELVVIDTLANLWPVESENEAAEVLDALSPLRDITQEGAGLLLIHHPRKGDSAGGSFTASRGSGALPAFADVLLEMRRYEPTNPEDTRRVVHAVGRYEGIPAERIYELTDEGYQRVEGASGMTQLADIDRVASILDDAVSPLTIDEIRERWTGRTIGRRRLAQLVGEGEQGGRWSRTGEGAKGAPWRFAPKPETNPGPNSLPECLSFPDTPGGSV